MKRSSLSPAASPGTSSTVRSGTRSALASGHVERPPDLFPGAVGAQQREEQDPDSDHDEAVREVERGPPPEIDEVGDVPEPDAVDEVRDAAADQEPEAGGNSRVPRAGAREVHEHPH